MTALPPPPRVEPSETSSRIWEPRGASGPDLAPAERSVMDQPSGCLAELQLQDVSPSDIPPGINLTRKGEDSPLGSTALDALQLVRSSGWYPNPSGPGSPFSDSSSSEPAILSRDQSQPDEAFSQTTVTLSYMSRSHVFSRNDSPSQHSPLYSIPPISKLSLHPRCGSESHLRITGCSQEQVEEPSDLPAQKEGLLPQAPAEHACRAGGRVTQCCLQLNGDGFVKKSVTEVEKHCHLRKDSGSLENGEPGGRSLSEGQSSPETLTSVTAPLEESGGCEAPLFSVVVSESTDAQNPCRDYRSPLEDPISPSSTSLDGVEDIFVLPQASRSPSTDRSHPETAKGGACEAWSAGISDGTTGLDSSDNDQPAHRPDPDFTVRNSENHQDPVVPHALQQEQEPPVPAGAGVQPETRIMSRSSPPSNISGCTLSTQDNSASCSASHHSAVGRPESNPVPDRESTPTLKRTNKGRSANVDSTSDSELQTKARKHPQVKKPVVPPRPRTVRSRRKPSSPSGLQAAANRTVTGAPQPPSQPGVPAEVTVPSLSSPPLQSESPKNQDKTKSREAPATGKEKGGRTPKRRRRKTKPSNPSSMFSPKEPEIKLRYVSFKEEKKESKVDSFSPFIRVERKPSPPPLCSVINYPEEVQAQQNMQPHPNSRSFVSAVVPSTSCLHMGRPSNHSQHRRAFICCLCGQPANAMDLGDLHGPYYPEGLRPSTKTAASTSSVKEEEEDVSESDPSSFSRRKSVAPHTAWSVRNQLKQNMESRRRVGGATNSPAAKQAMLVAGSSESQDWFSPPIVPQEPCEYWLHEDCSIWSAGVFLVKGRVYGLEEAVKAAHETVCSGCQRSGATLGCVFKGCPNKYHYRCALESGCALIEENFSMKCRKHKNKTLKAPWWGGR